MIKYVDKTCEYCGAELIHVPTKQRFCHECGKIRHRELNRERDRRKRGIYKDPLWREQVRETGDKERYENRLRRLIDDYRYGERHSVNVADIKRIKAAGKAMGYTAGIPDIIACIGGKFYGFEVKTERGKPTALQEVTMRKIQAAGGIAVVVRSVADIKAVLTEGSDGND